MVDLTGPRGDGRLTVAAGGHLSLLNAGGQPDPFARGSAGYATDPAPEPYVALAGDAPVAGTDCAFHRDTAYAIEPTGKTGVVVIDTTGQHGGWPTYPPHRTGGPSARSWAGASIRPGCLEEWCPVRVACERTLSR